MEFAESPDKTLLPDIQTYLKKPDVITSFVYDAITLCHQDGLFCDKEESVIKQLQKLATIEQSLIDEAKICVDLIHNKDLDKIYYNMISNAELLDNSNYLLQFYDLDVDGYKTKKEAIIKADLKHEFFELDSFD